MIFIKKYILPLFIVFISLFLLYVFRTLPASTLWQGYEVLYVHTDYNSKDILFVLEKNGCKNVISIENQLVPLNLPYNSPEISLALSGIEKSDYLNHRKNYFFDSTKKYSVYYIPDEFKDNLHNAENALKANGIEAAVNAKASYQWICPLIVLVYMVLLTFFAGKKILFLLYSFLPVFFSFMFPFYSAAVSSVMLLTVIFLSLRIRKRKNSIIFAFKNHFFKILCLFSFFLSCLSGLKPCIFFLVTLFAEILAVYLIENLIKFYERGYSFSPVFIMPASTVGLLNFKSAKFFLFFPVVCLILFLFAIFSSLGIASNSAKSKNLSLPAANGWGGNFPKIEDYINWRWEALTFPYISVNSPNYGKKNDFVSFTGYKHTDNGIIPTVNTIFFDEKFKNDCINQIDELNYPAVEKLLKRQHSGFSPGYVLSGKQNISLFMIFSLFASLVFAFIFYLKASGIYKRI